MRGSIMAAAGLCLLAAGSVQGEVYTGQVTNAATGQGVNGAGFLSGAGESAKSGADGCFSLEASVPGVSVTAFGFSDRAFTLHTGENLLPLHPLPAVVMPPVRVRGKADREKVVVSRQKVSAAEVKEVTATLFPDVVRVLQLMPGVTTDNDFSANMFVRGGGFDETIAVLDDMVVLVPTIWGGRVSVFNPNLVDSVDFSTGGFTAEWPQAMSAILNVHNKVGNPERLKGFVDLSSAALDVFLEGPLAGGPEGSSFLVGLRRTQYDLVYKYLSDENQVWPYFYDGEAKFYFPLGPAHLTVNALFSVEGMDFLIKKEPGYGLEHEGDSNYHYLDRKFNFSAAYDTPVTDRLSVMTLLGCFYNDGSYQLADVLTPFDTYQNQTILQLRHLWKFLPDDHQIIKAGLNVFSGDSDATVKATVKIPTAENRNFEQTIDHTFHSPWNHFSSVFLEDNVELIDDLLYLDPSANAQYYSLTRQWLADPRCGLKVRLSRDCDVYAATGQYSQFPLGAQYLDNQYGSPDLQAQAAIHYIVGTKITPGADYFFQLEGYYKDYRNLLVSDPDPASNYTNHAVGHAYGYDLIFQKKLGGSWDGWFTYSYVVSERKITQRSDPRAFGKPDQPEPVGQWVRADGDITHAFNVIINYNFSPEWKLAFTQKYSTGKPITAIAGGNAQPAIGEYTPVYGDYHGDRMQPYMTTDIKLSMPLGGWRGWSSYVQVSNLFDVKNVDSYQYRTDYSDKRPVYQLPRMILGGVRYEF
jgi:hypothetical protein